MIYGFIKDIIGKFKRPIMIDYDQFCKDCDYLLKDLSDLQGIEYISLAKEHNPNIEGVVNVESVRRSYTIKFEKIILDDSECFDKFESEIINIIKRLEMDGLCLFFDSLFMPKEIKLTTKNISTIFNESTNHIITYAMSGATDGFNNCLHSLLIQAEKPDQFTEGLYRWWQQ